MSSSRIRRKFTPEFKTEDVEMIEAADGNIAQVARDLSDRGSVTVDDIGPFAPRPVRPETGTPRLSTAVGQTARGARDVRIRRVVRVAATHSERSRGLDSTEDTGSRQTRSDLAA